jgi:fibronectin-binding autotransporter adhesin
MASPRRARRLSAQILSAQISSRTRPDPRKKRRSELHHFERLEDRVNLDTYLWQQTVAGTFNWNSSSNWNDITTFGHVGYPQAGDTADLISALTGNETITLNGGTFSLGALFIGAPPGNTNAFTVEDGNFSAVSNITKSSGGADVISAPIVTTGSLLLNDVSTAGLTISGVISGTGSLIKLGSADDVLSGTNTYSGGTTIGGGTLQLGSSTGLGTGSVNVNGGTLNISSFGESVAGLTLSGGSVIGTTGVLTSTSTYQVQSGSISAILGGSVGLNETTSGSVSLSGVNTYTGATTISAGTLSVASDANLGADPTSSTPGNIVLNGGTLQATASFTLNSNRGIAIGPSSGSGSGTIAVTSGNTLGYGGIVANNGSGSGGLTVNGGGTLLLSGSNTFSGGTTISGGTLQVGNGGSLGTGTITNDGSLVFDRSDTSTLSNSIVGTGSLTVEGGGSVTLSATNTDTGSIDILGSGTTLQTGSLPVAAAASISGFGGGGTGWQTNQSTNFHATPITNDVLELTDGNTSESTSAFDTTPVPTTGNFVASFTYTATSNGFPNNAADGAAFVLQAAGDTALGGGGGGLGVSGIAGPGLVLSFNIYQPSSVGAGFFAAASGTLSPNSGSYESVSPVTLNNADPKYVVISYNAAAQTLTEQLTDPTASPIATTTLTYTGVNLGSIFGGQTAYVGFTGGSGGATATQTISNFRFNTGNPSTGVTQVNLSNSSDLTGIYADGTTFSSSGGLDGVGDALSGNLLGSQIVWNGQSFALGQAGSNDVISAAGQIIPLPPVNDSQLMILGAAINGNQTGQTFTVTYTDGSTSTFTQSLSDWFTPQNYPGESIAAALPYRDLSTGGTGTGPFNVYGYTFDLDSSKTVASITLPNNGDVKILAIDLASLSPQVTVGTGACLSLGSSATLESLAGSGTVDLNGYPLTIGDVSNQSSTFSGTIANGSATGGSLVTAGTATLTLSGDNTFTGTTTVSAGTLQVGSASASEPWTSPTTIDEGASADFKNLNITGAQTTNDGTVAISDCTISGNTASGNGGGLNNSGTATLSYCTISGNTASGFGGGVYSRNGTITNLTDCTISGNTAGHGGGLLINDGTATLKYCTIADNVATSKGGGLDNYGGTAILEDCTISGNSAASSAGGIIAGLNHSQAPTTHLYDTTLAGNSAGASGVGGLYNQGVATLEDTIVAGNTAGSASSDIGGSGASSVTGSYNLIGTGGSGGVANTNGNTGNILGVATPDLGPLGDYGGPTQTIPLLAGSPAIGKGTAVSGLSNDQRGFALDSPVDIGAFQAQPSQSQLVVAVTGDAGAPAAEFDLRGAINVADLQGVAATITFSPTVFAAPETITLTAGQLELSAGSPTINGPAAGVTINGGASSQVLQVDPGVTATLSGGINLTSGSDSPASGLVLDIGTLDVDNGVTFGPGIITNGGSLIFDRTDVSTVANAISGSGSTTIEGGGTVTLSGANTYSGGTTISAGTLQVANGGSLGSGAIADNASLVFNRSDTTTIVNSISGSGTVIMEGGGTVALLGADTFTGTTTVIGGTLQVGSALVPMSWSSTTTVDGGASATFTDVTITGARMISKSTLALIGCTISRNTGAVNGGGVASYGGTLTLTNSTISGNSASDFGGGVYADNATVTLTDCTISGNSATGGGGLLVNRGTTSLIDCTIAANSVSGNGGALNNYGGAVTMEDCTIAGNLAGQGGGIFAGLNNGQQPTTTLITTTVADNSADSGAGGLQNEGTALLTDTIVADNSTGSPSAPSDIGGAGASSVTGSYNLIGTGGSGGISNGSSDNIVLTSLSGLGLGPLGNYGGPTQTIPLLPGSPALGAGVIADYPGTTTPITTDQRGLPLDSPTPDIGAFQSQGFTLTPASGSTPQFAPIGQAFTNPLAVTVTANNPDEPVAGGVINWSAPGSGASAVLSATSSPIGTGGVASVTATANITPGSYAVTASAGGPYTTTFLLTNTLPLAITSITAVSPNPRNTPVSSIEVTFNDPINTSSVASGAVTLTENGNPIALSGLTFTLVPGTSATYAVGSLSSFTAAVGTFVLTVNAADINDQHGFAGSGSASTSWVTELPAAVFVSAAFAGDAPGTAVNWTDGSTHYVGIDAFSTIQAGINGVAAGGTVSVASGTYSEQLTINQSLSLIGAGIASTTIQVPSSAAGNVEIEIVAGAAVSLSGITIDPAQPSTGIDVNGASLTANAITVTGFTTGISVENAGAVTITDSTISATTGINVGSAPSDNSSVIATNDSFAGDATGVLSNETAGPLNATLDWWGASSGPANVGNPGGTGAAASGYVDFNPWLGDNNIVVPDNLMVLASTGSQYAVTPDTGNTSLGLSINGSSAGSVIGGGTINFLGTGGTVTINGESGAGSSDVFNIQNSSVVFGAGDGLNGTTISFLGTGITRNVDAEGSMNTFNILGNGASGPSGSLVGDSGTNAFVFSGSSKLIGAIQGAGSSTLNYSGYGSGVNLDLGTGTNGTATGVTGTVSGITAVIGSNFNDTFNAGTVPNVVLTGGLGTNTLSGTGAGDSVVESLASSYTLTNTKLTGTSPTFTDNISGITIANLTGSSATSDSFTVSGWAGSGSLTAPAGSTASVTDSAAGSFTLSNSQLTAPNTTLSLNGITTANLTDSSTTGGDTFNLTGWAGGGTLKGKSETLVDSVAASVTLANASLVLAGGPSLSLSGFTTANLTDATGGNTFTVSGWTGGGALTNNNASLDTIVASKSANFTLSDTLLMSTDKMSLNLSGFGTAGLTATSAGRTFAVTGWTGSGSLTGAGTGDTVIDSDSGSFTLTNSQLTAPSTTLSLTGITTANLTDSSAGGGDSFMIAGWTGKGTLTGANEMLVDTVAADTTLTNTSLAVTGGPTLTLSGFTAANLTDTAGGNTFTVSGWTGGGLLANTGGSGDTLTATKAFGYILSNTGFSSGDGMGLGLSGFATANLADSSTGGHTFTVTGWTGGGTLRGKSETLIDSVGVSATLANASLAVGDQSVLNLSGFTTANLTDATGGNTFTVSGWTGSGTLTNNGSSPDTIAASKNAGYTLVNASLVSTDKMSLDLIGFGTADLTATSSDKTFTVTGWTGGGSLTGTGTGDTVIDSDNGSFTLTNNQLIAPTTTLSLTGITAANLTDSSTSGENTFTVTGWTGKGTLAGHQETLTDTMVAASTTLSNTSLAVTGGPTLTLGGFTTANLTDTIGGNTFTVSGWTGGGTLTNNGLLSDTIAASKSAGYTLMNGSLASTDNMSLVLSGFGTANLTASSSAKIFTVTGWTGSGSLKGVGDTVIDSDSGSFTLTNSQLTAPSTTLSLTGITTANLTDSSASGGNTFTVSGWTGKGTLTGNQETLVDRAAANTSLTNTSLAVTGGPTLTLGGFTTANLTDTAGGKTFTVSGWTGTGALTNTGGAGDTVTASKAFGYTLSNSELSSGDGMNLGLSGFTTANLTDSSTTGSNTFTATGWTGGGTLKGKTETVVDASAGGFTLSNSALSAGTVSLSLSGFTTANLTDSSMTGGNTFTVGGWTGKGTLTNNGASPDTIAASKSANFTLSNGLLKATDNMSLSFSGITTANLTATSAGKTFTVANWTGAGSLTGSGTGDTVIDSDSGSFTLTNGQLTAPSTTLSLSDITTAKLATTAPSGGAVTVIDASAFTGVTNLTATGAGNVILYGGAAAKNTLTAAGTGDDILIGNGSTDTLTDTGSGMNILIGGGGGGDTLTGNGNDILVSGATEYDSNTAANIAALDAVLAEWTSSDSYGTRIEKIMSGVGPGGTDALNANTVTQDAKANTLQDGTTQTQFGNWFLYWSDSAGKDTVKKNRVETQNLL